MTEHAMLMQLVADADRIEPNWGDALHRAGFVRGRLALGGALRPGRLVAFAAVVLLAGFAVSAVASERPRRPVYWLFDRSSQTYPVVQTPTVGEWKLRKRAGYDFVQTEKGLVPSVRTFPIVHGAVANHPWEMLLRFGSRVGGSRVGGYKFLTVVLSPGGTPAPYHGTNVPAWLGGAGAGYRVRWMPGGEDADDRLVWGGVYIPDRIASGGGTGPKWHFGPAAPSVAEVDLENNDGRVVRVPTFAGPKSLVAPTRLWVAALPLTHLIHTIVARDERGDVLERHRLPIAQ